MNSNNKSEIYTNVVKGIFTSYSEILGQKGDVLLMVDTAKTFIRIPSKVSTDEKLSAGAKLLFGEVYKLNTYNTTCCATNQYFATKFSVSITTIKRRVSELVKGVWINRVITYKSNGNKVFASRFLGVTTKAFEEEEQTAERDNKVVNAVTLI